MKYTVKIYETKSGKSPFNDWIDDLETTVQLKMLARVRRASEGNFGDHEPVGDGMSELKTDSGPGYRMYYTIIGRKLILLLTAGTKKTQDRDIKKAKEYLADFTRGAQNGKNKRF